MDDPFEANRRLLFDVAYRMTGSVADAEDLVQEAWLRWAGADRSGVEHPKAYLVRTVTNLALNRLRSAQARREAYVGPWLPEPLLTTPDIAEEAELADSISMAMLVVLETLSPVERAVFLLREVFGFSHAEIALAVDRPEATVRQISHRAREHVQARRPRYDADRAEHRRITEEFRAACAGRDLNALMAMLAPDVTAWTDGGGKVQAALRPLHGPDHVARWILGVLAKPESADVELVPAEMNGEPGLLLMVGGEPVGAIGLDVLGGQVAAMRLIVNPDKLGGLG